MSDKINIYSKGEYPSNVLSNFYPNNFEIDGVNCGSMEGFLQSLKYKNPDKQKEVCRLSGKDAKLMGKHKFLWKVSGNVYWQGKKIKRQSEQFAFLIKRAYKCLSANPEFFAALKAAGDKELAHSIGKSNKRTTILTEQEFISNLNEIRNQLINK